MGKGFGVGGPGYVEFGPNLEVNIFVFFCILVYFSSKKSNLGFPSPFSQLLAGLLNVFTLFYYNCAGSPRVGTHPIFSKKLGFPLFYFDGHCIRLLEN